MSIFSVVDYLERRVNLYDAILNRVANGDLCEVVENNGGVLASFDTDQSCMNLFTPVADAPENQLLIALNQFFNQSGMIYILGAAVKFHPVLSLTSRKVYKIYSVIMV